MCGIAGGVAWRGALAPPALDAMREALVHRGPEGGATWIAEDGRAGLAHRRLSFLDLGPDARQPLASEDGACRLVANGEIYNFAALRRELEALGHRFRSHTDSEVVLHGWEAWGLGVLERLDGMFAIALWDDRRRTLLLARDRFGIKPLYVTRRDDRLLFASEAKGLLAHPGERPAVDWGAAADLLVYRYVPSPRTAFRGIEKLEPASWLTVDDAGVVRRGRYWAPPAAEPHRPLAEGAVGELLHGAVARQLVADVPLGAWLSGGHDSSAVALVLAELARPVPAFSIGFEDWAGSEHAAAAEVAGLCGLPHRLWMLGTESLALVERLCEVYDEPLADLSIVPTFALAHLSARTVKGVLSGEGGDELFGGYDWQRELAARAAAGGAIDPVADYAHATAMGGFDRAALEELFAPDLHGALPEDPLWFFRGQLVAGLGPLEQIRRFDLRGFLGELVLTKVDRAAMACSLEVRVPFLDHALFDAVWPLADNLRFQTGVAKPLLRGALGRRLPARLLARPKQGFVGPDRHYADLGFYRRLLGEECRLVRDGALRRAGIDRWLAAGDPWRLWKLAVLELWYRRWGCRP